MEQVSVFFTRRELEEAIASLEIGQEMGGEDCPDEASALKKMRDAHRQLGGKERGKE